MSRSAHRVLACAALAALATSPAAQMVPVSRPLVDAPLVVGGDLHRFEYLLDLDADADMDLFGWYWEDAQKNDILIHGHINDAGDIAAAWEVVFPVDVGAAPSYDSAAGEVNGDGRGDFVIAIDDDLWVWTSKGAEAPTLTFTHVLPAPIQSLVMADFDGDGLDDFAYTAGGTAHVYLNQVGPPAFAPSDTFSYGGDGELVAGEISGDADDDLLMMRGGVLDLFTIVDGVHTATTTFGHGLPFGPTQDHHIAVGDVDADTDTDIVVFANTQYAVFRRVAPASFVKDPNGTGGPATDLADVNGDGYLDGVCCSSGGSYANTAVSRFEIAINDGNGGFAPAFEIEGLGAEHIAGAADLDGDGDADLAAGRVVYFANGPIEGPAGVHLEDVLTREHLADFDGDGDVDLGFGTVGTLRNLADGATFEGFTPICPDPPLPPGPPDDHRFVGPGYQGDFDGDGDVDLLVTWVSGELPTTFHGMRLLENNGVGNLFDAGEASAGVEMNFTTGARDDPRYGRVVDIDGDDDLDFLAVSATSSGIDVWLNDGTGFFTAVPDPKLPHNFHAEWVADFTGDGLPDLLCNANLWPRFCAGLGDGTFATAVDLVGGDIDNYANILGVGDLDGDADLDIVVPDKIHRTAVVHWNDGAGSFTFDDTVFPADLLPTTTTQRIAHLVDLDDDGLLDLVLGPAVGATTGCWIFLQEPGGAWSEPSLHIGQPRAFADLDGDGDLDAVSDVLAKNVRYTLPDAGRRLQYGVGTVAGLGGAGGIPVAGATGPFRVGEDIEIRFTGLRANAIGLISVGLAESSLPNTPWPNTVALNWPWIFHFLALGFGPGELPGDASLVMPYTVEPIVPLAGPLYLQGYFHDPTALYSRVVTNGLLLEFED